METKARRGDGEYARLYEGAEGRNSRGTQVFFVMMIVDDDDVYYYNC